MTDVRIPDIGDFKDVPVIEVLVKPGDVVKKEDPLVTLESEKAAFDVPAPDDGVVSEVKIHVGDKVSMGTVILTIDSGETHAPPETPAAPALAPATPAAPVSARAATASLDISVPDIGDFSDVPIIEVLVKPGDVLKKEDPLITLESEKAAFDVPAPVEGVVGDVKVRVGDKVSRGTVILTLATPTASDTPPAPVPARETAAQVERAPVSVPQAPPAQISTNGSSAGVHASPSIRRFARELGVDLQNVTGTGPRGRVTQEDVQSYVKGALAQPNATGGAGLGIAPWPKIDFSAQGPTTTEPLSRIRKISGPNLHRNWVMIPHVTNHDDADVTELEAFRNEINAEQGKGGVKVTLLAFLIKAVVSALQHFPEFNSSLDGDRLVLKQYYNVGFAADTPGGLMVPVVKEADHKGVLAIAQETRDLAEKARDGKLGPAQMSASTFTISSLGGIGGSYFTPIINAPEVAILGVGRAVMRPTWNGKSFEPRLILPLSLSWDHRVIDGAGAARFNAHIVSVLADMRRSVL